MRRVLLFGVGLVLLLAAVSAAAIIVFTNTQVGRERVRHFALGKLNSNLTGSAQIGALDGNLLLGFSFGEVAILDTAGVPILSAARLSGRYRVLDLLRKRVELSDVRAIRPRLVMEQSLDGEWTISSLLREDTAVRRVAEQLGWGDRVSLKDVTIEDGIVVVRTPWRPDSSLVLSARDSATTNALNGGRLRVERTPAGLQRVMTIREIHAILPRVRLADPDSAATAIDLGALRAIAEPFRGPPAIVRDLAAIVRVTNDSVAIRNARLFLPSSRLTGYATFARAGESAEVRTRVEMLSFADLRWLRPELPADGGGSLDFALVRDSVFSDFTARRIDLRTGSATLTGEAGVRISDSAEIHDTDLRFSQVGSRLIEQLAPGVNIPREGALSGRAKLWGTISALRVDGDVAFVDARSGTSRVLATGEIGFAKGFRARGLRVQAMPLRVDLVSAIGSVPLRGTLTGRATIDGAAGSAWRVDGDVTHFDRGERSRLVGRARVTPGRRKVIHADVRALPLSLATVGRSAPELILRGEVSGPVRVRGNLGDLVLDAELALPDAGSLDAKGRLDLSGSEPAYNVTLLLVGANASAISARAPETLLTGTISATGRGLDPGTMRASIAADMSASRVDTVSIDALHVQAQIAEGIATVDTLSATGAGIVASAGGTIGLVEARSGNLAYHIRVSSLASLARWIQSDTGRVRPRPWRNARKLAIARADSARIFEETRIERDATGGTPPTLVVDTAGAIPRDSLAGSIETRGVLKGSIRRFDLSGNATVKDVVARGSAIKSGEVEYSVLSTTGPARRIAATAALAGVEVAGFGFDSAIGRVSYSDSATTGEVALRQDDSSSYRLAGNFASAGEGTDILLREIVLRFDTTVWSATRPVSARFGAALLKIDTLDLRSNDGGHVQLAMDFSSQGSGSGELIATGVEISHVAKLLQAKPEAKGTVTISARGDGTAANPRLEGTFRVANGAYRTNAFPSLTAALEYAERRLVGNARLAHSDTTLATAEYSAPLNLAFSGVSGRRLDPDGALTLDARAKDLPLTTFPGLSALVENLTGLASATLSVRGTPKRPELSGEGSVRGGSFRLAPANITFTDVAASMHIRGDTVSLDSLVARSDGTVRVRGSIGIETLSRPVFALALDARNLRVLGGRSGSIHADSHLDITGPANDLLIAGHARVANGFFDASGPSGDAITLINTGDPELYAILDTSLAPTQEPGLPPRVQALGNMRLDVGLRIDRNVWLRTAPDGNLEIFTAIDLGVRFDKRSGLWTFNGLVNTAGGDYTFQARRFTMARGSGSMSGTPGVDPVIQATGVHDVWLTGQEPVQLRIIISGTTDKPRIAMEGSNRPPGPSEIAQSYITFSRPFTSVLQQGGSSLSGASTATGSLSGATGVLARRQQASVAMGVITHEVGIGAVRSLYFDVFTVTPGDVPTEHSESRMGGIGGIVVTAGKLLNPETQISVQLRPATIYPGLRFQRRLWGRLLLDAGIEPRWVPTAPYLSADQAPRTKRAFGAFLTREWEF